MRQNPSFAMTDVAELRRLIDANPWVTLVSATDDGLVASHYAVLLDEDRDDLTIVGHVGRPDDLIHGLGERELLVVVQGPHGYISPGLVRRRRERADVELRLGASHRHPGAAHARGEPARARAARRAIRERDAAAPAAVGAAERPRLRHASSSAGPIGFRLTPTKVVAKRKLSQNRPDEVDRDDHRRARGGREPVRRSAARRRDAARPRRQEGGAVSLGRGEAVAVIANVRLTGAERTDPFGDDPVDIHIADGVDRRHRPRRRARRAAGAVLDGDGAWADPGPVGPPRARRAVGARRPARAARRRRPRRRTPPRIMGDAPRAARRPAGRHRIPRRAVVRCADARGARRRDRRGADLPHQRRRAQRVAQHRRAATRGLRARRRRHPPRGAGVRDLAPAQRRRRRRSPIRSSRRWRGMPRPAASSGLVDLDMAWNEDAWARRARAPGSTLLRVEFGIYPQFLDRAIAEGLRSGDPARGAASDLARVGPLKVITDGSLGTRTAACSHALPGRSAQPRTAHRRSRDARRPHDARDRRRASRPPSTRSATSPTRTRSTRSPRPARGARSSTRSSSRTPTSRGSRGSASARQRAARARDRRPRHHRCDLGRPDGAALPAARPRRHRREPAVRLGRARLAARPVGGDGGRGLPHARRPRAVAAAAGGRMPRPPSPHRRTAGRPTARASSRARVADLALCARDPLAASEAELRGDDGRGDAARRAADAPGVR